MLKWLKQLWTGDDGYQYALVTEPSIYRIPESRLEGPFTKRQALRFANRYLDAHPFGEVRFYYAPWGSVWPPKTNWVPRH